MSIFLPWHAPSPPLPSAPPPTVWCIAHVIPWKPPFVVGRRPALNSSDYLCSRWYADPLLSHSTVTTTCLFGDSGNPRGEGLPLGCTPPPLPPVVKAHWVLETRALIASRCFRFVGDYGIIIRSKVQRDVPLHPVDLGFWFAQAGVCKLRECWRCCSLLSKAKQQK